MLSCTINVVLNMAFKTKIEQLKTAVSLENIADNISCEYGTEMTSFVWILLHCIFFIIRSYLLTEDGGKA